MSFLVVRLQRRAGGEAGRVAGEFVAKNMHRPQFARAMGAGAGDVGLTEGYWRVMTHVAGKTDEGILGKSRLVRAADATVLWDSKRLFDMPGGVAAMFRNGAFEPWPPGSPVPE